MTERIVLCPADDIPSGTSRGFQLGPSREVVVANVAGTLHAIDGVCPHRSASLAQGALDGATVTCPWHGYRFDVRTGHGLTNPHSSVGPPRVGGVVGYVGV